MLDYSPFDLEERIEAYEAEQARRGEADLAAFLPDPTDPLYLEVLRELVRVDMEYSWRQGRPRRLEDYQARFPELFADADCCQAVVFEEYRLRERAGENPRPDDYKQRFGVNPLDGSMRAAVGKKPMSRGVDAKESVASRRVPMFANGTPNGTGPDTSLEAASQAYRDYLQQRPLGAADNLDSWCESFAGNHDHARLFQEIHRSYPEAASELAEALTSMPEAGADFLGFHLIAELGRGAFARVFLAEQAELSNRWVVLKISSDVAGESQTLAQLQHTNIVPIYSVHQASPFQAVCMPYFGSTTLHDVFADLQRQPTLPNSGKGIVSTLNAHKSSTQLRSSRTGADSKKRPVAEAEAVPPAPRVPPPAKDVTTTLKTLEGFTYVQAIVWLGARLADGLAHAHDRGILHRDLKPANILLTDEGQPMLLDFNLSEDSKVRGNPSAALIGGTLPYMAPEHLDAFRGNKKPIDARSDLYALGIILYELLTLRHPFATQRGDLDTVIPRMIEERRQASPELRRVNPAVSPAVESIIRHCLEPAPERRYQTAHELREDLQRQLDDRPLKYAPDPSYRQRVQKWLRRHPRLTSSVLVGAIVLVTAVATGYGLKARQAYQEQKAKDSFKEFHHDLRTAELLLNTQRNDPAKEKEGLAACQACLDRYQVTTNRDWQRLPAVQCLQPLDRELLREDLGELLLLMAQTNTKPSTRSSAQGPQENQLHAALSWNLRAEECYPPDKVPALVWLQRAELYQLLGRGSEAQELQEKARNTPLRSAKERYLLAADHTAHDRFAEALPLLEEVTRGDPQNFWSWFMMGRCQYRLELFTEASASYRVCVALWPENAWAHFNLGWARYRQNEFRQAVDEFDAAVRANPAGPDAYLGRALAWQGLRQYQKAIDDLTLALQHGARETRIYFLRARNRDRLGDPEGGMFDWVEGLKRPPVDELSWIERGYAKMNVDPEGALSDFNQALQINPRLLAALQNKARILTLQGHIEEAVQILDQEIKYYPDSMTARSGRGVLLARLGKNKEAHQDAEAALRRDRSPAIVYQVAGIYALTSRQNPNDRAKALALLSSALQKGFGFEYLANDKDLDPIRDLPEFRRLTNAVRDLRAAVPAGPR